MSNYVERIKLLTELFDEGHITEQEFGELVGSIRGGAVNEAYDQVGINSEDKVSIGGYDLVVEGDEQWLEEVNNPNKLDEYETFFNNSGFTHHGYHDNSKRYNKWKSNKVNECNVRCEGDEVVCNHPFISFENNEPTPVKEHPAYPKILQAIKEGKIVLS